MKGNWMAKRSSFGRTVRKRLSDITNSLPQPKSPSPQKKLSWSDLAPQEYIDNLVKENMALANQITDKNKLIELAGEELQKLRINLQKIQLQNWNLAQSNSHMLAELNLGKGKLKALQHEILCKDALLKTKSAKLEEGGAEEEHKLQKGRRKLPTRSQSMGGATTFKHVAEKETCTNKRRCLRRQSARTSTTHEEESIESLVEIECKEEEEESSAGKVVDGRTSLSRPSRRAAERVQSYKEVPLNVKMRRPQ